MKLCDGVFLMAIISSCRSFVTTRAPFISRKSSAETISQYAIVHPIVTSSTGKLHQGHSPKLTVLLEIDRATSFKIQLTLNHKLLPPSFKTAHHDYKGDMVYGSHQNCFYQGTVVGHPKWLAEFSTCSGLRGSFGDIQDRQFYYHLEPLGDSITFNQPHAVYMDSENKARKEGRCGSNGHATSDQQLDPDQLISHRLDFSPYRIKRQNSNGLRIMEWLIVNDYDKYNVTYNNNLTATELRSIEIANTVNMLYSPLGIRVVLVHMITITSAAKRFEESSASGLLNAFRSYHQNSIPSTIEHDSALLMTGISFGGIIGVANIGTMCGGSNAIGFTVDTGQNLASVSASAAHELGHIFNMLHDNADPNRVCTCGGDEPGCIMAGIASTSPATRFSNCSVADLMMGYSSRNTGACLSNDPSVIIGTATCGNGVKEPGEVCDCGPAQTCNDPCCNATSCELLSTAQCGAGACCQNCQFKAHGTICRPDSNECGLSEYCTGDNAECPSDVFRQDGQPCASNTAYCFNGQCVISRDLQCKQYYGSSSATAQPICYTTNNIVGQTQGHCGANNGQFIPCLQENAFCGSIQCTGGNFNQSAVVFQTPLRLNTTFVGPNQDQCNTFTTFSTSNEISPGLVLNGTRCGNEMLCMNHQCVSVSSLPILSCPVGTNGAVCSDNGVCNNLNQCFCTIGFTGSSCSNSTIATTLSPETEQSDTPTISNNGAGEILVPVVVSVSVVMAIVILSSVVVFTVCCLLMRKHRAAPQDMIPVKRNSAYGQVKSIEMQENHAYSVVSVPEDHYATILEVQEIGIRSNNDNDDDNHYYI